VIVSGAELTWREEVVLCRIKKDLFCHNFLKELATALQERYWLVGLRNPVIYFTRFGNRDNFCQVPRVVSQAYSSIEQGWEAGW